MNYEQMPSRAALPTPTDPWRCPRRWRMIPSGALPRNVSLGRLVEGGKLQHSTSAAGGIDKEHGIHQGYLNPVQGLSSTCHGKESSGLCAGWGLCSSSSARLLLTFWMAKWDPIVLRRFQVLWWFWKRPFDMEVKSYWSLWSPQTQKRKAHTRMLHAEKPPSHGNLWGAFWKKKVWTHPPSKRDLKNYTENHWRTLHSQILSLIQDTQSL